MGLFGKSKRKAAEKAGGSYQLLSDRFMAQNTKFATLTAMLDQMGYKVTSQQELDAVPVDQLDRFVGENTRYMTWAEMRSAAERASDAA